VIEKTRPGKLLVSAGGTFASGHVQYRSRSAGKGVDAGSWGISSTMLSEMTQRRLVEREESGATVAALPQLDVTDVGELALHWLGADDAPRLIIDSTLAIQWLNLSAERELRRRRGVMRRGELLMATSTLQQGELIAFLRRCGEGGGTLCLRGEDQDGHLLLIAQPLPGDRFGLVFRRCGAEFSPAYADLQAAFQLTRSETTVLLQLADGYSASQIARRLGVSTATTRSHIKSLHVKLNVKSREGLLSRIRAYQM
jgi:DNA-binding CsgD family transcriptional regulator